MLRKSDPIVNRILPILLAAVICVMLCGRISDSAPVSSAEVVSSHAFSLTTTTSLHSETTLLETADTTWGDMVTAGLLFDVTHQRILFSKNADQPIYPASLTKLLTPCVALQYVSADTVFSVGSELTLLHADSSLCYIRKGHRLTLYDLISGMLMVSGNDAAYTIAVNVTRQMYPEKTLTDRQALEQFCKQMNRFAADIGMKNSYFTNPDGWDDKEQYTTVHDLLTLALYAQNVPEIAEITQAASRRVIFASGQSITWKNTNLLLDKNSPYYYPFATGMKTGTTDLAGKCLLASAARNGQTLLVIGMGCDTEQKRYAFATQLFDSVWGTFPSKTTSIG